jgi:hypothetical protein
MTKTFCTVFKQPLYLLIASFVGVVVFSLAVWLPNVALIKTVLLSQTASILEKVMFALSLYGSIITNFTLESAIYTIFIATLFGVYISLLVYYIRTTRVKGNGLKSGWLGIGGLVSGFFGIGCAACGTVILSSIATFGGASLLLVLPLGGRELGYLGVGLLVYAIYSLSKKIKEPLICS